MIRGLVVALVATLVVALVATLVVACSAPASSGPTLVPGRRASTGDASYVTQENGTVITVERMLEEHKADGRVLLFGIDLEAAQSSSHKRLAAARAWLAIANTADALPPAIYQAARRGVIELGGDYVQTGARDTTLALEQQAEADNAAKRFEQAASRMREVLEQRLALYAKKFASQVD